MQTFIEINKDKAKQVSVNKYGMGERPYITIMCDTATLSF